MYIYILYTYLYTYIYIYMYELYIHIVYIINIWSYLKSLHMWKNKHLHSSGEFLLKLDSSIQVSLISPEWNMWHPRLSPCSTASVPLGLLGLLGVLFGWDWLINLTHWKTRFEYKKNLKIKGVPARWVPYHLLNGVIYNPFFMAF